MMRTSKAVIRTATQGERRWFYGGAVHTWKLTAEETNGAFFLHEETMEKGKMTPLHTHPADETLYVLAGEIVVHLHDKEHLLGTGGLAFAPLGVPHAFMVTSEVARVLCLHTPGNCQSFYFGASDPIGDEQPAAFVDFDRVRASAQRNGGIEILGPPPFDQSPRNA